MFVAAGSELQAKSGASSHKALVQVDGRCAEIVGLGSPSAYDRVNASDYFCRMEASMPVAKTLL